MSIETDYLHEQIDTLRAELAEAKKFKDGMLDVLGGACPNDHRSTPFEEFKGCTPCLRAELAEAQRNGYIIAMRLLQSDLLIDEAEGAAMQSFLTREAIDAAMAGGE